MKKIVFTGIVAFVLGTRAHGSLNLPLPRNNAGQLPLNTTAGESHGPSCLGDACGWFAAGCFHNCAVCTNASNGADVPSYPPPEGECEAVLLPTLPSQFRTYNRWGKSKLGDWTASHPWRAPGKAPNHDACGLSGAYSVGPGVSGYPPLYPGSHIAPTLPAVWQAGGVAEAAWSIWSNHGRNTQPFPSAQSQPSQPRGPLLQAGATYTESARRCVIPPRTAFRRTCSALQQTRQLSAHPGATSPTLRFRRTTSALAPTLWAQ